MAADVRDVGGSDQMILARLEMLLADGGFDVLPKGRGDAHVMRRFFRLPQLRGVLRARMVRDGVLPSDPIGLHYSSSDNVILYHVVRLGISSVVAASSPQGLSVLWGFGLDAAWFNRPFES
jgi:hypothetical protein